MPGFVEIQVANFDRDSLNALWTNLRSLDATTVKINLNTETATLEAVVKDWEQGSSNYIGVKINAYETMLIWDRLARSNVTDQEFERLIFDEAEYILQEISLARPATLKVYSYSIDGDKINIEKNN